MAEAIDFSKYDIIATLKINQTLPDQILENLENCSPFKGERIKKFSTVKNIIDSNNIPLSYIILDGITYDEYYAINGGTVLIDIVISFQGNPVYKNIYNIIKFETMENNTSKTAAYGYTKLQVLIQSVYVFNLLHEKTFYTLTKTNVSNFFNLDTYNECISNLSQRFGSAIGANTNVTGNSISSFSEYYFDPNITDFSSLEKLVFIDRTSIYPVLFGIDEIFTSITAVNGGTLDVPRGLVTEIFLSDLKNLDQFQFVGGTVSKFLKDSSYGLSSPILVKPFFTNDFIKRFLQSKILYKNTVDNSIIELPSLKNITFKLEKTLDGNPVDYYALGSNTSTELIEGNLNVEDFQAYRENILKFLEKRPVIYKCYIQDGILDLFKLGRKIDFLNLKGNTITVGANIVFDFISDMNPQPGQVIDKSNHKCSGELYVLNYQ